MADVSPVGEIAPVVLRDEFIPKGTLSTDRKIILAAIVRSTQEERAALSDQLTELCEPVDELSTGEQSRLEQLVSLLGAPVLKETRLDQLIGEPTPIERTKSRDLRGSSHSSTAAGRWRSGHR